MTDSYTPSSSSSGASGSAGDPAEELVEGVPVVRDRRRLDPETGQVREPAPAEAGAAPAPESVDPGTTGPVSAPSESDTAGLLVAAEQLAADRFGDLQRLQAEYVNYRRRVDRDRDAVREGALAAVLEALLPVLDDIALARQHGDLDTGPFAAIAEKLEAALGRLGLERYGASGEVFDPAVHEALMHGVDESADPGAGTVVTQVLQPGYRMTGAPGRVLRAARVAVVSPA